MSTRYQLAGLHINLFEGTVTPLVRITALGHEPREIGLEESSGVLAQAQQYLEHEILPLVRARPGFESTEAVDGVPVAVARAQAAAERRAQRTREDDEFRLREAALERKRQEPNPDDPNPGVSSQENGQ